MRIATTIGLALSVALAACGPKNSPAPVQTGPSLTDPAAAPEPKKSPEQAFLDEFVRVLKEKDAVGFRALLSARIGAERDADGDIQTSLDGWTRDSEMDLDNVPAARWNDDHTKIMVDETHGIRVVEENGQLKLDEN